SLTASDAGTNGARTQARRGHADRRLGKLQKYFDDNRPMRADVVLSTEREQHIAEVTVQVGSLLLRGVGRTDDMYVSIDSAVDRIARQVRKFKTRINRKLQEGAKAARAAAVSVDAAAEEPETEASEPRAVQIGS